MKLWTIQPQEVLDELEQKGVYRCDYAKSENQEECFRVAYEWLAAKMREKVVPPEGVSFPVWAWYKRYGKHKKPDLRTSGLAERGRKMLCLEIEIPDTEVVLSDFDAWHFVLNRMYLDDSTCEAEWDANHAAYDALSPIEQKKVLRESWERIFDVSPFKSDWKTRGDFVQATFWELRKDQIRKIQPFTCR